MITKSIGEGGQYLLDRIVSLLGRWRINPNLITLLGFAINVIATAFLSVGSFFTAGCVIFLAGMMDMLDGAVARGTNTITQFGGFFDSVIDRYSDMAMFFGLIIFYGLQSRMDYVILVGACILGSVMTSYTRARAESIIKICKVGFLERPERVVLVILGCWLNRIEHVLWIIAIFSNWAVISRIAYTYRELGTVNIILPIAQSQPEPELETANPSINR